jgi:hypothetical protein
MTDVSANLLAQHLPLDGLATRRNGDANPPLSATTQMPAQAGIFVSGTLASRKNKRPCLSTEPSALHFGVLPIFPSYWLNAVLPASRSGAAPA